MAVSFTTLSRDLPAGPTSMIAARRRRSKYDQILDYTDSNVNLWISSFSPNLARSTWIRGLVIRRVFGHLGPSPPTSSSTGVPSPVDLARRWTSLLIFFFFPPPPTTGPARPCQAPGPLRGGAWDPSGGGGRATGEDLRWSSPRSQVLSSFCSNDSWA